MRPMVKLVLLAVAVSVAVACLGTYLLDIPARPGRIILGVLLFDVSMKVFVILLLFIDRRDAQVFLKGAHDLLTWAKDARNSAEHRAATVVNRAVGEMKQEAAKVVEAAEAVKTVAGAVAPTPVPPAKEVQ